MSLKKERLSAGLTQKELGELAGISDVKISYIENGRIKPENILLRTALKLAKALNCEPSQLLEDDDNAGL